MRCTRGEILGLSGLVGSGRSETMRAIFGMDPLTSGKIYLEGKEIKIHKPRDAIRRGHRDDQRGPQGLWPVPVSLASREHLAAQPARAPRRACFINQRREKVECRGIAQMLRVKIRRHRGGRLLASAAATSRRWSWPSGSCPDPKVLILDEPTRGVDVGAKSEIHSLMCKFASEGMAIIMVSSELPEIMGISDRILIYHEGRLNGEVTLSGHPVGQRWARKTILAKEFGG